jgi:hypothetical protein
MNGLSKGRVVPRYLVGDARISPRSLAYGFSLVNRELQSDACLMAPISLREA